MEIITVARLQTTEYIQTLQTLPHTVSVWWGRALRLGPDERTSDEDEGWPCVQQTVDCTQHRRVWPEAETLPQEQWGWGRGEQSN